MEGYTYSLWGGKVEGLRRTVYHLWKIFFWRGQKKKQFFNVGEKLVVSGVRNVFERWGRKRVKKSKGKKNELTLILGNYG